MIMSVINKIVIFKPNKGKSINNSVNRIINFPR